MRRSRIYWTAGAALLLTGLFIIVQVFNIGKSEPAEAFYIGLPTFETSIGNPDAPIVVEEYFDFQCPACHAASDIVVKPLVESHVAEGNVRFIYRMFPVLGPESVLAAQGAFCAIQQDEFWPFYDRLMARRGTGNRGAYSRSRLIQDARAIGLDENAFVQCIDGEDSRRYVETWHNRAVSMGLRGTPTFLVNGRAVPNSYAAVEAAIQQELARLGSGSDE